MFKKTCLVGTVSSRRALCFEERSLRRCSNRSSPPTSGDARDWPPPNPKLFLPPPFSPGKIDGTGGLAAAPPVSADATSGGCGDRDLGGGGGSRFRWRPPAWRHPPPRPTPSLLPRPTPPGPARPALPKARCNISFFASAASTRRSFHIPGVGELGDLQADLFRNTSIPDFFRHYYYYIIIIICSNDCKFMYHIYFLLNTHR